MKTRIRAIALTLAAGLALTACGGNDTPSGSSDVTLNIVGFAVPEAANKAIAAEWNKTDAGKGVKFKTSYGASGDQSRAVVNGLKADYVHFSVSSDVTRLVDAGLVDAGWNAGPTKGIVSSSVVVFAVRKGNPKGIRSWDDLIKPGIGIVTPNPASSGAARWNALAAWGHISANGGTEAQASDYLTKLFANVVSLPGSGREATTSFLGGTGDVLLAYENEAILAVQNGQELEWVYPDTTILIENPGAILKDANPEGQGVDRLCPQQGRAASVRAEGLPSYHRRRRHDGHQGRAGRREPVPQARQAAHGRHRLRELVRPVEEVLRREGRPHRQDHCRLREG
ncbi:sulfate ABC transporter substrate-binding protein [Luedemannella flava]